MTLDEILFWLWMNTEMVLCETEVISGQFFHKNSHILQNMPQNVLKCNCIVIGYAIIK